MEYFCHFNGIYRPVQFLLTPQGCVREVLQTAPKVIIIRDCNLQTLNPKIFNYRKYDKVNMYIPVEDNMFDFQKLHIGIEGYFLIGPLLCPTSD